MASSAEELDGAPDSRVELTPSFRFFPAAPPLSYFVEYLFRSHVPGPFLKQVQGLRLPEVEAQLVFTIEEGHYFPGGTGLGNGLRASLFLQPAHLQVFAIPGSIRGALGVALRPSGLRLVLPTGAACLVDAPLISLEDLWGAEGRALLERLIEAGTPVRRLALLERYLQVRAERLSAPSHAARHAFDLIQAAHGEVSTEQLAHACGCSSRTLRNLTVAEAGLPPKHLARIVRIRHALDLLSDAGVPLSAAAATSAFSDQAHMSREFRELLGEPPSQVGQHLRSPALPRFSAERNLLSTGLLLVPKLGPS